MTVGGIGRYAEDMHVAPRGSKATMARVALSAAVALIVTACGVVGTGGLEPLPPGPPLECVGVPAMTCQQANQDARNNAAPGVVPVRVRVVCTSATCTPEAGEVQVDIGYSDGRRDGYAMSWASAGEAPVSDPDELPVEVCQGVPEAPCQDAAQGAVARFGGQKVASIVVTCTVRECTDAAGETSTTVTFADGTSETQSSGYLGGSDS